MIMERGQSIPEKPETLSHPHNENPPAKILLPADFPDPRISRLSWDKEIPKDTEHRNSQKGASLKDMRRFSQQSTVWDLQKPIAQGGLDIVVYKRRWVMLVILLVYGIVGTLQWPMYSIIANVITTYYRVPNLFVDFTNLSFLIVYLILFLPTTWLLNRVGIRCTLISSCLLNAVGCFLRVFSDPRDRFWLTMLGQVVVGVSQVPVAIIPARLAVVWFPTHQVSLALAIGFNGILVGNAVGFLLPPLFVRNSDNMDEVGADLNVLYMSVAICAFVILAVAALFFQDQPPLPPSQAQKTQGNLEAGKDSSLQEFVGTLKYLLRKKSYLIFLLSFSLNVGVFVALATLLNQVMIPHFPGHEKEVGLAGLILILSGVVSSLVCGYILDRTHAFKMTLQALYIVSLVGWIGVAVFIHLENMTWVLITTAVLGFALGNQPVALELGVEITYPTSEGVSSGLLIGIVQTFGIANTLVYGYMLDTWGDAVTNAVMTIPIVASIVSLMFMHPRLKRQAAEHEKNPEQLGTLKR